MPHLDRSHKLYVYLAAVFVSALLVADITGGKLFRVGPLTLSVGNISFPLTFVLTDILNEFYGKQGARFATLVGCWMAVFAYTVIYIARSLPVSPESPIAGPAFETVFGMSNRVFVASLIAFLLGQFTDIHVFTFWKALTQHRHLWLRATGSTFVSQFIDTGVVQFITFGGKLPQARIVELALTSYTLKFVIAAALTPIIYLAHGLIKRRLGLEPAAVRPLNLRKGGGEGA
jgi:hypothetical protein